MITLLGLEERLRSLKEQHKTVSSLKQFREQDDEARKAYLQAIAARIDELGNLIQRLKEP